MPRRTLTSRPVLGVRLAARTATPWRDYLVLSAYFAAQAASGAVHVLSLGYLTTDWPSAILFSDWAEGGSQ